MKITPRHIAFAATAASLLTIAACGGSDSPDEKVVTPTYQKNAALPVTTLPATTAPAMKATTLAPKPVTATPTTRPGRKNITVSSPSPRT